MGTKRADKLDILRYIKSQGYIELWQMMEHFGYSYHSAFKTLSRLKTRGLIIDMTKGQWELTEEGYRRLKYYAEINKEGKK